jgi:hypothetical protein
VSILRLLNHPEESNVTETSLEDDEVTETEAASTQRRKKSTGFPVVSLAEAAEILKEAGKYGFEHSTSAFASYMGHSTTNSGAFRQRLAAFRDWKLIAGRGDSLAMTDIARMIALPTDDIAELRALQAAFMNSSVFFRLYEDSAKGQPLAMDRLGGRAVHDFGISPGSKDKFAQSFSESAVAAGLAKRTDDGLVLLPFGEGDDEVEEGQPDPSAQASASGPTTPSRPQAHHSTPPVVHQTWVIDGGSIVFEIRTDKPLPATAFATVGEVVASLEHLAETLAPHPQSGAATAEDSES